MRRLVRCLTAALIITPMVAVAARANAESNDVGLTPALGWSSWSFIRHSPTTAKIEAQADAMKSSGLAAVGYQYINLDDFWYQCPGSQGPNVDQFGRWVTDATKFPASGATDGIQVVADHVHADGLKFGLYVTPGISKQAVAQNTAIEGTPYHADDIATTSTEHNYNCKGMVGIDYTKPGAQAFIDSWANQFASWGIDYLKIDGVGSPDVPDVQAWSSALRQTGRPIHLELSNNLNIADAPTWAQLSNGWRTGGDIECYGCEKGGSSYPLTHWDSVAGRFNQVANWQPFGGPGAFNDYDSLELGNGANDGLTPDERRTQLSLWALASSPLILGTDLTNLDQTDLADLTNTDVLSVDQDAIDAARIASSATTQVFAKQENSTTAVVGLFNTGGQPQLISTTAAAIGLPGAGHWLMNNLWSHQRTETAGVIGANVPPHGVALFRVSLAPSSVLVPPSVTLDMSGLSTMTAGVPATATLSFTDNGVLPAQWARLDLHAPAGWTVTPTSRTLFAAVPRGRTVQATFVVVAPTPATLFQVDTVSGSAVSTWPGSTWQGNGVTATVTTSPPVTAPYRTFSSATDAPAAFGQAGPQFGISGAGADLFTGTDAYSATYLAGAVTSTSTIDTQVVSQQGLAGFGKAGILVRDDITGSGTTPEGVVLFESPSGGIQLEWDDNGGTNITSVTPANGVNPDIVPVWLKLERTGSTYTGYYSVNGTEWFTVGTATVPGQADTQDAGIFVTSHASGSPAQAVFNGLTVTEGAVPPPPGPTSYEAESTANTIAGGARLANCAACSDGQKVGFVGNGGTLTFNNVTVPTAGTYAVTIYYLNGPPGRQATVSVNGGAPQTLSFTPTADFNTVGTMAVPLALSAGANTIEFANPTAFAPDFDRITVSAQPS
ncbi:MAG TPA: CBM35 domain-containing protein [Pseudonocardiaceae bacterium]|nr:CBM35 domain-containing protein [Pseudonocardiaceae bacterium]